MESEATPITFIVGYPKASLLGALIRFNHRISQFADDTTIFARDYDDAAHIWPILDLYEADTGMRANSNKFLAIQDAGGGNSLPINLVCPSSSIWQDVCDPFYLRQCKVSVVVPNQPG
eukprot:scaffold15999_cov209-Isochrysis_galbana.AAC.2